jgi:tetratricopeptide (TPR) repeat protein
MDPGPMLQAARAALASARHAEAIQTLGTLIHFHPKLVDARVMLASAQMLAGRPEEALLETDRALELAPGEPGTWLTRSAALEGLDRLPEAEAAAARAAEIDPASLTALTNLAAIRRRVANLAGEADALARLAKLAPEDPAHVLALGRNAIARQKPEEAQALLEGLVARHPRLGEAHLVLALVDLELGRTRRAMDRANIALRLDQALGDKARDVFRAAFYVGVAAELVCKKGPRPWPNEAVEGVLAGYRAEGLAATESFHDLDRELGASPVIQRRVTQVARTCQKP